MSGGQQQRVAIARAPWWADRGFSWPTSPPASRLEDQREVMALLRGLSEAGLTSSGHARA